MSALSVGQTNAPNLDLAKGPTCAKSASSAWGPSPLSVNTGPRAATICSSMLCILLKEGVLYVESVGAQ